MTDLNSSDEHIEISVDNSVYSKDALFKCLYWYTNVFQIDVITQDGHFHIKLTPSVHLSDEERKDYLVKLNRDLVDFNLRDIITKETKNIRELLIAKAFSNGEFDEEPPGSISDPIGFDISKITDGCN